MSAMDLQAVVSGTQENRVEALRQILDYPLKQRDPGGSRFWFLRPGADEDVEAAHPKYVNGKVVINKKGDGFIGVPEEVWNLYVGGYQVCQKWLKDLKGSTLSPEDIIHYQRIIVALQETIRLMQQIDAAIPGWPLE